MEPIRRTGDAIHLDLIPEIFLFILYSSLSSGYEREARLSDLSEDQEFNRAQELFDTIPKFFAELPDDQRKLAIMELNLILSGEDTRWIKADKKVKGTPYKITQ